MDELKTILEKISPETLKNIGFDVDGGATPLNYIMTVIPVIPICDRLPVEQDGEIRYDFITLAYKDIVRLNNDILNALTDEEKDRKILLLADRISQMYKGKKRKWMQMKNLFVVISKEKTLFLGQI